MGKAGNSRRKADKKDKAKEAAGTVLRKAAQAEAKARVNEQEIIEMERAYGPVDDIDPKEDMIDPLGDQGDGKDAFGREIQQDAGHPRSADNDVGSRVMAGTEVPWEVQDDNMWASYDSDEARALMAVAKAGPPTREGDPIPLPPPEERWRVMIAKDTRVEFPELYMEVFVAASSPYEEAQFAELLVRSYCQRADSVDGADLVIFTGGPDVQPSLYGEAQHSMTKFRKDRDDSDKVLYDYCLSRGIPMFGVCRGAQFLHVMNGGKLYQHVNNHYGKHKIVDVHTKETYEATSVHHQMCIPQKGMTLIATSNEATERWLNPKECHRGSRAEVEAFFYDETLCLGIQGHPEYQKDSPRYSAWCMKQIEEAILLNTDLDWVDNHRRLLPDLLIQRNQKGK